MIQRQAARVCMDGVENRSTHTTEQRIADRDGLDGGFISAVQAAWGDSTTNYYLNIIYSSIVVVTKSKYNLSTTNS